MEQRIPASRHHTLNSTGYRVPTTLQATQYITPTLQAKPLQTLSLVPFSRSAWPQLDKRVFHPSSRVMCHAWRTSHSNRRGPHPSRMDCEQTHAKNKTQHAAEAEQRRKDSRRNCHADIVQDLTILTICGNKQ